MAAPSSRSAAPSSCAAAPSPCSAGLANAKRGPANRFALPRPVRQGREHSSAGPGGADAVGEGAGRVAIAEFEGRIEPAIEHGDVLLAPEAQEQGLVHAAHVLAQDALQDPGLAL